MPDRPYLFYELTNSLCATCLRKVEAKVVMQDGNVYLLKHCPTHGARGAERANELTTRDSMRRGDEREGRARRSTLAWHYRQIDQLMAGH